MALLRGKSRFWEFHYWMDRRWGFFAVECLGIKKIPVLGWPQIVYLQLVVMECAGSGVGVRLSDHGWSSLCRPGDCWMVLQIREGKRKR